RINTRDTGVHDFLQKSKIYESLINQYQFQLNVLPATKKILNAITKIGGYQIKEIRDLQARIILAQSAQSKPYQQEFSLIVADASESYIKEVERFSEMIGTQLENTSRKKETLIEQIDDIEYKASDRADIAISLTEKIQEYNSGITECRTAIAEIKKRGRGDYSEEDSQALSMYEAKMKEFQHGIKIFNRSIRESDKDLIHYDAKLDSKQELLKQHESVEGDQLDAYGTVIGNIERARAYLGNGDVDSGFHEIFETMNELQDLNNGLVNILGAYNQHFAKESTQIREFKTGKMNASQESDMQSRLETNGRTTQDLREKYKTKEDQIP
ncbi:MAG: hypothetical protein KAR20_01105, partial [Candidatus Heimdallarchaeota archaeon]|nr:hypothetical protein [Candidatus Heimdallarchaeota archaeon]